MAAKDTPDVERIGHVEKDAQPSIEGDLGPMQVVRDVKDSDGDGKDDSKAVNEVDVYEVTIERSNNEKISTEVFAYEVPVLERVHGSLTFTGYPADAEIDDVEPAYSVKIDGDANDVYRRLQNKFDNTVNGTVVATVYRDAKELAKMAGLPMPKGKAKEVPQSENVDNRKKAAAKR